MKSKLTSTYYVRRISKSTDPIEFAYNMSHFLSFLNRRADYAIAQYNEGVREFNLEKIQKALAIEY